MTTMEQAMSDAMRRRLKKLADADKAKKPDEISPDDEADEPTQVNGKY
jgi:hypothetical protein